MTRNDNDPSFGLICIQYVKQLWQKRETIKTDSGNARFDDFDQLVDVVCLDAVPTLGDDDTFAFA